MHNAADFTRAVLDGLAAWIPGVTAEAAASLDASVSRMSVPAERDEAADALTVLQRQGTVFSNAFAGALRRMVEDADRDPDSHRRAGHAAAGSGVELSLIADTQIDEDIEMARIMQRIDAAADTELRQLASLCSSLKSMTAVRVEAIPLHPGLCARALRQALADFALPATARLLLLRQVGAALAAQMRGVYAAQCRLLEQWGVAPAQYRIVQTPTGRAPARAVAGPESGAGAMAQAVPADTQASLARLVQWALRNADLAPTDPAAAAPAGSELRLFSEPIPAGSHLARPAAALDAGAAARVMQLLLGELDRPAALSDSARRRVRQLQEPARRIAEHEADLWVTPDHPWWQLLDRIIALGNEPDATDAADAAAPGTMAASLDRAIDRLAQAPAIDRGACLSAVAEVDRAADIQLQQRSGAARQEAVAIESQAAREEVEVALRNQVVQQLRLNPVPPGVRQFLVGPWVLALADVTLREGASSPSLETLAQLIDELVHAGRQAAQPLPTAARRALLKRVHRGLVQGGLMPARIEAELADLSAVLKQPPPVDDNAWLPAFSDTLALADGAAGYDALPTVPIDMYDSGGPTDASRDRLAWLDSLVTGTRCRMFVQGRWADTQLTWVNPNRSLYVFSSSHGGRSHSMTRRMLEKLRGAGLAATLAPGDLLARAMDSLTDNAPLGA
jgi:hypothetical protein